MRLICGAHVIGDKVEQQAYAQPANMRNELLETFSAAYVRVKLVEIAGVVTMRAKGDGFENR